MSYENVKNSRARLKNRAVYVLGGKCQICGYNKCQQALEFHHINPDEKSFTIQENCNRSWETVNSEIQKCALLCANCHREVHSGLIDSPQHSPYDETRAEEISNLIEDLKTHKVSYCKECGVEVYRGNDRCPSCAAKSKRKTERPSREELKKLIRTESFVSIAKQFGVTDNAVRKWCDSYGLPRKVSDIKQYSDEEWQNI